MTAHTLRASQYAAGEPTAVVPDFIGQIYVNTTPSPKTVYVSFGTSAGNWKKVGAFPVHGLNDTDWHTGVSGAVENNWVTFDASGLPADSGVSSADFQQKAALFTPKVYRQATMPTLSENGGAAIWQDTDDDKTYLVYRRGDGDQVSVELGYPLTPP